VRVGVAPASESDVARRAAAEPGLAGIANQSQRFGSQVSDPIAARQRTSICCLLASPAPTLVGASQSSGRNFGIDVPGWGGGGGSDVTLAAVPSEPTFPNQQLPVLWA